MRLATCDLLGCGCGADGNGDILMETMKDIDSKEYHETTRLQHRLINDHFQNFKSYQIPKAQLLLADIPYNTGKNAYGSNPSWYVGGDNANGESKLANTEFFDTDKDFRISEFLNFCSRMIKKEPKETGKAPAMLVFCAFDQQFELIEKAKEFGLNNYINLVFVKNFSAQVLKANMRVVGNCEYGILLYRDKLPKFNNNGKMIFNAMPWEKDSTSVKLHPCLPAGEKVFFNNEWKNIEDVNIGDSNRYGKVANITKHYAKKLVEIKCGENKVIATWNHPFLIKRGSRIYWINAEQIQEKDLALESAFVHNTHKPQILQHEEVTCKKNIRKQRKGILGLQKTTMENSGLNIVLFGKGIMASCRSVCKYTTRILTRQTTIFPIYNLSLPLSTNGITLVADWSTENGKSPAQYVENSNQPRMNTGISQEDGLTENYAKYASPKKALKQERFLFQTVGSVKIINEKTLVYNLSIDGIPAFDTEIGLSHNTQKPVKLLKKLICIFTDAGDVVIDPVAGSGSTIIAAMQTDRSAYGFEIKKDFYKAANEWIRRESLQGKLMF